MFTIIDSEQCFSKDNSPYELKKGEFNVVEPYFRCKEIPVVKKRKTTPSNTDIETKKRHDSLRPVILSCLEKIQTEWPWKDQNTSETHLDFSEKNKIDFASMQEMVEAAHFKFDIVQKDDKETIEEYEFTSSVTTELDLFSLFHCWCANKSKNKVKLLQLTPDATYLIPSSSAFLMGSLEHTMDLLGNYINQRGGADLIVMDPPWPNKSVHRSSGYETLDIYDFFRIPIPDMIGSKDTIVAIWVTNKPKFRKFILNKLFPAWQLECVGEWIWLKMTTQGEPIFPIDSEHKKPYEQLILGRPKKTRSITIPTSHVITSIPSKRHSRKPPLQDVLSKYMTKEKDLVNVELFARCLMPGWISWGNECLKFQHLDYFDKTQLV